MNPSFIVIQSARVNALNAMLLRIWNKFEKTYKRCCYFQFDKIGLNYPLGGAVLFSDLASQPPHQPSLCLARRNAVMGREGGQMGRLQI